MVDETRELEQAATWDNPADFVRTVSRSYRRDFWKQQPVRIEAWSEKGTVRDVLQPVLDEYGVGFRVMHGFGSATIINDICQNDDGRPLIILYIGGCDPSRLWMSERDIPERLSRYGGNHISIRRIALLHDDCMLLGRRPAFNVKGKKDPRGLWFRNSYGQLCWELDEWNPAICARVSKSRSCGMSVNQHPSGALTHFWCSDRRAAGGTVADSTSWGTPVFVRLG